jgi:hypothetical protein
MDANDTDFFRYIHCGGKDWALAQLPKNVSTFERIALAKQRLKEYEPAQGMAGRARHINTEGRSKYHWPQVAWGDAVKVGSRRTLEARQRLVTTMSAAFVPPVQVP